VIEKARLIFKNLIRMGPDLNFELFKAKLLERKFRLNERIVPTPEGPLKEYVLTEPRYLRDLIIVSRKGFVVDSRDLNYVLDLINIAYEIYEEAMMDYVEYIQTEIVGIYELVALVRDAEAIIAGLHDRSRFSRVRRLLGIGSLRPFGVAYAYGVPKAPHEFVVVNMVPIVQPFGKSTRVKIGVNYHGVDPEKGIRFLRGLGGFVERLIKAVSLEGRSE